MLAIGQIIMKLGSAELSIRLDKIGVIIYTYRCKVIHL